ncbi:MAG TPA: glucan biosynthesis protein D [Steroidobacteraceae bacterium]|nr:glucan biosynthesis protein D [Steroidobacteraceae bacterium]
MIDRRSLLATAGASLALSALGLTRQAHAATAALKLGPSHPFSFDGLTKEMEDLAARPYQPAPSLPQQVLDRIDYEAHGKIKFDTDCALFRDGPGEFPVTFFHLGHFFTTPVHMYVAAAESASTAREILYDPGCFSMPADSPARQLPKGAGFAGFRFQESRLGNQHELDWRTNDWVAFLGASYFRAIGELYQYGLSARGIALDVAMPDHAEEFPAFTRFYFEPPADGSRAVTVYAALEGPSVTGAFKFVMHREKDVTMEIDARLFLRKDVSHFGIAPMTSMFWYAETTKPTAIDWRPEVHDSDGLALWTGAGEHIWRPLNNPERPVTSAFADKSPRGFGLLQRDRVFDHYLDGVRYDRRPSLWVEPIGDWGEGSVQLVELPTDDEIHDNIVAMWVPKQPARAGSNFHLRYRLYWSADEPHPTTLARCVATRLGRGGQPGKARPKGVHKFMVEFLGGPLATLPFGVKPQPVLTAASGTFSYVFTEAVPDGIPGHWRAQFDFEPASDEPVDMRLFLKNGDQTLSETWLYQFRPA